MNIHWRTVTLQVGETVDVTPRSRGVVTASVRRRRSDWSNLGRQADRRRCSSYVWIVVDSGRGGFGLGHWTSIDVRFHKTTSAVVVKSGGEYGECSTAVDGSRLLINHVGLHLVSTDFDVFAVR